MRAVIYSESMYLDAVIAALKQLGSGYFVWRDDTGDELVIMTKREFNRLAPRTDDEVQLPLAVAQKPERPAAFEREAGEVLQRINHELAEYQAAQEEEEMYEALLEGESLPDTAPPHPSPFQGEGDVLKVRFEPLRGDLPPELQE